MEVFQYIHDNLSTGNSLFLCLIIVITFSVIFRAWNLPPGPWGLPWLGIVPYLVFAEYVGGVQRHETLAKLSAKYGKVFSFTAFGRLVIVLSDADIVKEAFSHPDLNNRPEVNIGSLPKGTGVALASGKTWWQQRMFTIRTLERFGVGKPAYEGNITTEAKTLIDEIAKNGTVPFDPKHYLMLCVSNIITQFLFSTKHNYDDADYMNYQDMVAEVTHLMGSAGVANSIPLVRYLPIPSRIRLSKLVCAELDDMLRIIKTHRDSLDRGNIRNYVDEYLTEILNKREQGVPSEVSDANLPKTLLQLYSAGTENAATTLRWALLYMIGKPAIQARVQDELDRVVGRERLPALADEPLLPYTRATLLEIHRVASVVPLGTAHVSSKRLTCRGWTIPAHTTVIPNAWAIHSDPKIWNDPSAFKPERFIGENNKIINEDRLIPFSAGNRICFGRHLSRMELFIFFTHLMHRFSFRKVGSSPISFRGHGNFALVPDDYMLQVSGRD